MNAAPRTYLFVPGNRPERFAKAMASGADAVVLDLEDAVNDADKPVAREAIARWLRDAAGVDRARAVVRVNEVGSAAFDDDARWLHGVGVGMLMLPKVESSQAVARLRAAEPGCGVLALIETAAGVANVDAVAASEGVSRLVFGTLDFALDLDLDIQDQPDGLLYAASRLVLASRLAGRAPPVAGVTPQLEDDARLLGDLAWARRIGFGAKLCIHPRQVMPIHAALAPDKAAVDWASRVLAAEAASPGAARLDGRMIDRPVVLQAQRTLRRAGH
jgi:citrate lyase subunit beta / citryl-CoA lyase